jgi:hypothetical protein
VEVFDPASTRDAAKPNQLMLCRATSVFVVRTIRNTQIHSVDRMQRSSAQKQEVQAEPLGFEGLMEQDVFVCGRA